MCGDMGDAATTPKSLPFPSLPPLLSVVQPLLLASQLSRDDHSALMLDPYRRHIYVLMEAKASSVMHMARYTGLTVGRKRALQKLCFAA